jgi:enoyl-CoA hydratase/carnithine racemase
MSDRILRTDRDNGLCTLTFNRPEKINALDTQFFEELNAYLAELENSADRIGCVVLRGTGKGFSAGADLNAMGKHPVSPKFKPGVIERLQCLPQPVIAAVHGVCYTGGLEMALACDFIIADSTARFADTHGKWGLVAAWGMMQRLPRRIGVSAAKKMMMTGSIIDADEAKAIGLIDTVSAENALDALLDELSESILANSWHTNFAVKKLLRETGGMSLAEGLAYERYRNPGNALDYEERIARFTKKS